MKYIWKMRLERCLLQPQIHSLKLTAKAPKNDGFQVRNLQTSRGIFSGVMLVSGRVVQVEFISILENGKTYSTIIFVNTTICGNNIINTLVGTNGVYFK